jgi:Na+-translocating ferredoxin:NAD+ oxidoreductase RnfD subunit
MARFVTGGGIDLKLCTYVPLGKSNSQATLLQIFSNSYFGGVFFMCADDVVSSSLVFKMRYAFPKFQGV